MARTDTLVQTLLPPELAAWVRARAALEGLQVSGWVRQLIVRERLRLVVEAWWCRSRHEQRRKNAVAPFRVERLGCGADGAIEFRLLDGDHGEVTDAVLAKKHKAMHDALYDGAFVLRGDTRTWRVIHAAADADAGNTMRLVMRPESTATTPRRRSR